MIEINREEKIAFDVGSSNDIQFLQQQHELAYDFASTVCAKVGAYDRAAVLFRSSRRHNVRPTCKFSNFILKDPYRTRLLDKNTPWLSTAREEMRAVLELPKIISNCKKTHRSIEMRKQLNLCARATEKLTLTSI